MGSNSKKSNPPGSSKERRRQRRENLRRETANPHPSIGETAFPLVGSHSAPQHPQLPWYESTLFWGAFGAAVAIVLTVVAAMTKDLNWILILAWPFFFLCSWAVFNRLRSRFIQSTLIVTINVLSAFGLWWLHSLLAAQHAMAEPHAPSNNSVSIQTVPVVPKRTVKATPQKSTPRLIQSPTPTPSPTPAPDDLAALIAKKLVDQHLTGNATPLPTPLPKPLCRGDKLIQCTDEDLLEWGKPLLAEIARYGGYYEEEMNTARGLHGKKMLDAYEQAQNTLADRFRDCCAEETDSYYREIASRVGGGHKQTEFSAWKDELMSPVGSKEWKESRSKARFEIIKIQYELQMRMIDLESAIKSARLRK